MLNERYLLSLCLKIYDSENNSLLSMVYTPSIEGFFSCSKQEHLFYFKFYGMVDLSVVFRIHLKDSLSFNNADVTVIYCVYNLSQLKEEIYLCVSMLLLKV